MHVNDKSLNATKRHWLLSFTLVFLGLNYILLAFSYFVLFDEVERMEYGISFIHTGLLGVLCLINVYCMYLISLWKKAGIMIFTMSVLGNILMNGLAGVSFPSFLFGSWGLLLLCLILFLKKNGNSGWSNLLG